MGITIVRFSSFHPRVRQKHKKDVNIRHIFHQVKHTTALTVSLLCDSFARFSIIIIIIILSNSVTLSSSNMNVIAIIIVL